MPGSGSVLDAGEAWLDAGAGGRGTVCGVFGRAAYLRVDSQLLALCHPEVASGPLHLRVDPFPMLVTGQPATLAGGQLEVGQLAVRIGPAQRWAPQPVDAEALHRRTTGASAHFWSPETPEVGTPGGVGLAVEVLVAARRLVADDDLLGLARAVGGQGPGLTPAGDDLLAGVLVVDAVLRPAGVARRVQAATAAATTDVAAAFLRWAAVGQCIQPVHDVIEALVRGEAAGVAAARRRLQRIGASSGKALLAGLDFRLCTESAR